MISNQEDISQSLSKKDLKEVREFMKKYGGLSHTWLQRKFNLTYAVAISLKQKLIDRYQN